MAAFQDTLAGAANGALAGRKSTSNNTWRNSTATDGQGAAAAIATVTAAGGFSGPGIVTGSAGNAASGVVADWTPPASPAGYGILACVDYAMTDNCQIGPLIRFSDAGNNTTGYLLNLDSYTSPPGYYLWQLPAWTKLGNTAHAFSTPVSVALYLSAVPDGTGGVTVTGYADGTQVVQVHQATAGIPAVGLAAVRVAPVNVTDAAILWVQTDPQSAALALAGSASGPAGQPTGDLTLTLEVPTTLGTTVAWSDGGAGGTFSPSATTDLAAAAARTPGGRVATVTYTPSPSATGTITLSATATSTSTASPTVTVTPASISYAITATGFTLSGPTAGPVGSASAAFSVTPSPAQADTVNLADGGAGGTFAPPSLTFTTASAAAQTFTYKATSAGNKSIAATSVKGSLVSGSPWTYAATAVATQYAWSGASGGTPGIASGAIILTPNGWVATDTVTPSDDAMGGTFNPASLAVGPGTAAVHCSYTPSPSATGTLTLSATSAASLAFTPASWSFAVLTQMMFVSSTKGLPTGESSTATATPVAFDGTAFATPTGATAGTVVESAEPGAYFANVTYPGGSLPPGTTPEVVWVVAGQTVVDPAPIPATRLAASPTPTPTPVAIATGSVWYDPDAGTLLMPAPRPTPVPTPTPTPTPARRGWHG